MKIDSLGRLRPLDGLIPPAGVRFVATSSGLPRSGLATLSLTCVTAFASGCGPVGDFNAMNAARDAVERELAAPIASYKLLSQREDLYGQRVNLAAVTIRNSVGTPPPNGLTESLAIATQISRSWPQSYSDMKTATAAALTATAQPTARVKTSDWLCGTQLARNTSQAPSSRPASGFGANGTRSSGGAALQEVLATVAWDASYVFCLPRGQDTTSIRTHGLDLRDVFADFGVETSSFYLRPLVLPRVRTGATRLVLDIPGPSGTPQSIEIPVTEGWYVTWLDDDTAWYISAAHEVGPDRNQLTPYPPHILSLDFH